MKHLGKRLLVLLLLIAGLLGCGEVWAQAEETQQLLLNLQKLNQLRQILKDMKKGYEIVSRGYTTIRDISQGNFHLHRTFLDGLLAVSPAVRKYHRVADILTNQKRLVGEYQRAFRRFRQDPAFTPQEIAYLERVYGQLFRLSLKNLDELLMVITASKLRMSDEERLSAIDRLYAEMADQLAFLRVFNNETGLLARQRTREKGEINTVKGLNGVNR